LSEEEEAPRTRSGKKVMPAAKAAKKSAQLKKDLEDEQRELGKMMMTKRQRNLFQQADKEKTKLKASAKALVDKKKKLAKTK
jgi:hypothetical protein